MWFQLGQFVSEKIKMSKLTVNEVTQSEKLKSMKSTKEKE
jgi:hypothetical protein